MKKLLAWLATGLLTAFLVCDPQVGVIEYQLEVNGAQDQTVYAAEPDGSALINIDTYTPGNYTFRLKAVGQGGWPSDWSDPLDATKPLKSGSVRIEDQ